MLEYTLEDNELTKTEGDLRAQVVNIRSYTAGDIADRIMKIGAGLTRSDVASVLEAAKQVIADIIADGGAVHFDLFNAFPSIQGVFSGADDSFDPAKHRIKANLHAGAALREAVGKIRVKKVVAVLTGTVITSVTDIKTGSVNGTLTPGKDAKLSGVKLRIAGEDASVGLHFVPADGEPVKVDASELVVNNPGEIIAVIPALDAGTYRARIITQFGSGGKNLKTPHSFTYSKDLTVS